MENLPHRQALHLALARLGGVSGRATSHKVGAKSVHRLSNAIRVDPVVHGLPFLARDKNPGVAQRGEMGRGSGLREPKSLRDLAYGQLDITPEQKQNLLALWVCQSLKKTLYFDAERLALCRHISSMPCSRTIHLLISSYRVLTLRFEHDT